MGNVQTMPAQSVEMARVGQVAVAVILGWLVFALVGELEPNGRHLLVLGALRIVLFATLLAFAIHASATGSRLARLGLVLAGSMAALNLVGGAGAVVTDGWRYNPFEASSDAAPPWYAYVVGASAILFAVGTVLVGVAARRAGWLSLAAVAAGATYPLAFVLQAPLGATQGAVVGHLLWMATWLAFAAGLALTSRRTPTH